MHGPHLRVRSAPTIAIGFHCADLIYYHMDGLMVLIPTPRVACADKFELYVRCTQYI